MIDEKKIANAAMSDDELDQVAGGGFSKEEAEKIAGALGEELKELGPIIQKMIEIFNGNANNDKV